MIKITPIDDEFIVKKLFEFKNIEFTENSAVLCATDGKKEVGYCFLEISTRGLEILHIHLDSTDEFIADWMIRSAANYGANHGAYIAYTSVKGFEKLLETLTFKHKCGEYVGEIPEIFRSCKSCSC